MYLSSANHFQQLLGMKRARPQEYNYIKDQAESKQAQKQP